MELSQNWVHTKLHRTLWITGNKVSTGYSLGHKIQKLMRYFWNANKKNNKHPYLCKKPQLLSWTFSLSSRPGYVTVYWCLHLQAHSISSSSHLNLSPPSFADVPLSSPCLNSASPTDASGHLTECLPVLASTPHRPQPTAALTSPGPRHPTSHSSLSSGPPSLLFPEFAARCHFRNAKFLSYEHFQGWYFYLLLYSQDLAYYLLHNRYLDVGWRKKTQKQIFFLKTRPFPVPLPVYKKIIFIDACTSLMQCGSPPPPWSSSDVSERSWEMADPEDSQGKGS